MQRGCQWFHAEDNINQIRILGTNYLELRPFPPTYIRSKRPKQWQFPLWNLTERITDFYRNGLTQNPATAFYTYWMLLTLTTFGMVWETVLNLMVILWILWKWENSRRQVKRKQTNAYMSQKPVNSNTRPAHLCSVEGETSNHLVSNSYLAQVHPRPIHTLRPTFWNAEIEMAFYKNDKQVVFRFFSSVSKSVMRESPVRDHTMEAAASYRSRCAQNCDVTQ